jgi:hypothetical protein
LGERLEVHRGSRQKLHPHLTLTDTYNVVEKLRLELPLDDDDQRARDETLADTLRRIHDEIDAATLNAYGWPEGLSDEEILERVVALNAQRAEDEEHGIIRYLRPEYQAPVAAPPQPSLPGTEAAAPKQAASDSQATAKMTKLAWPGDLPARIQILTALLRELGEPIDTKTLAAAFKGAKLDDLELTLRCAAAADAVAMLEGPRGGVRWAGRS